MRDRRSKAILLSAAALGFTLRLAFSLGYWVDKPMTKDEREYLSLARSLAGGRGYSYDEDVLVQPMEPVGRVPGYPLFLALVGAGGRPTTAVPASVKIVQSAVGAVGVVLTCAGGAWSRSRSTDRNGNRI